MGGFDQDKAPPCPSTLEEFIAFQKADEAALGDLPAKGLLKPQ